MNKSNELSFVWVADPSMARRYRRELATQRGVQQGIRVGTTPELLSVLRDIYLLPAATDWSIHLQRCLACAPEAFWARSFQRDPKGVTAAVEAAWREIRLNVPLQDAWPTHSDARLNKRLADLDLLNVIPVEHWPEDVATMAMVLSGSYQPIRALAISCKTPVAPKTLWEQQIASMHPASNGSVPLSVKWDRGTSTGGKSEVQSRLNRVQSHFGKGHDAWVLPEDDSFQCVNVRDGLEAIELALSSIQHQLRAASDSKPSDFGLLIPRNYVHASRLASMAEKAGVPLANLPTVKNDRDLGAELVRFAIMVMMGSPPSMALRALLSNPLMPWSLAEGRKMADTLLDYGFSIKKPRSLSDVSHRVLSLFEQDHAVDALPGSLDVLVASLSQEEALLLHRERAEVLAAQVSEAIRAGIRDVKALLAMIPVLSVAAERERNISQEGVCVYVEGEFPLRPVQRLFVLDFNDGHFPTIPALSPAFSLEEWRRLKEAGIPIVMPAEAAQWQREMFRRQMDDVHEQVVVLIPRFNAQGDRLNPSVSLMDFARLDGEVNEPEDIVLDIDREDDRRHMSWLAEAAACVAQPPRQPDVTDLTLGTNLLSDFDARKDKPRTLSPSKLDGLLVSPMAWLLDTIDALPQLWGPDQFDALTSGSIAHAVFEHVFSAGTSQVSASTIEETVPALFDAAVRQQAPALSAPEWAVEREHLMGTILKGAKHWAEMLEAIGADVVQAEMKMHGHVNNIALSGIADAVIRLPNGALAVVDYKTASASRYLKRMEAGWDLQTALYSKMLATGGPRDPELKERLADLDASSVTYFTLKDVSACANYAPPQSIRGWRFAGADTSSQALSALSGRFDELKAGQVLMPRATVLKLMEKAGIGSYAMQASPLASVVVDDTEGAA